MPIHTRLATALGLALSLGMPAVSIAAAVEDEAVADASNARPLSRVEVREQAPVALAPLAPEAARERLAERPGGTAVLDAEVYRQGRVAHLADSLRLAPGVLAQPRFGSDEARVAIRGSGLQRTFHGRGLVLLQDGAPINLADGSFDMQTVEPLMARYVEIWRGASALEYGAATLGGAINFVSLTGHDLDGPVLRMEAGEHAYARGQVLLGGAGEAFDGVLGITGMAQDGYRRNARQESYRALGNLGWRLGEAAEARLYLARAESRSALPGALTRAQFEADPRQASAGSVALDQRRDLVLDRVGLRVGWLDGGGGEWIASAFVSDKALDHPIFQWLLIDSRDLGADLRNRRSFDVANGQAVLSWGLSWSRGVSEDERFVNRGNRHPDGRAGARTGRSDQIARNQSAFIEAQWPASERLVLIGGAHGVRAERESRDLFRAGGIDRSFERRYQRASPRLGARYTVSEAVTLFGNLSDSFEPPSFGELAGGPGITQVDAQRGRTGEIGLRMRRGGLDMDVAAYRAHLRDELLALTDGAGNPLGTVNAARTLHQGLELAGRWQAADSVSLAVSALLNDFRFDGDPVYGNNRLAGVPRTVLRGELGWQPVSWLSITPTLDWAPGRSAVDHANTYHAPGYAVWGLRLGGPAGGSLRWFLDLRNLTDRAWVSSYSVVADARGLDGAYFLPGDGRSAYVGLEWRR